MQNLLYHGSRFETITLHSDQQSNTSFLIKFFEHHGLSKSDIKMESRLNDCIEKVFKSSELGFNYLKGESKNAKQLYNLLITDPDRQFYRVSGERGERKFNFYVLRTKREDNLITTHIIFATYSYI